jgi:hypothetical protein
MKNNIINFFKRIWNFILITIDPDDVKPRSKKRIKSNPKKSTNKVVKSKKPKVNSASQKSKRKNQNL